jgi:hypothetical protein
LEGKVSQSDIRLVAKIYRAIQDFSSGSTIDQAKCESIARLIAADENRMQLEALIEQHTDRIQTMQADEFVRFLRDEAGRPSAAQRRWREVVGV